MKHVLVVQSSELARQDAEPFIPDSMLLEGLWGIKVFGPYDSQKEASAALRTFPPNEYNLSVVPMNSLSEELDNPYGAIVNGDAPEWTI